MKNEDMKRKKVLSVFISLSSLFMLWFFLSICFIKAVISDMDIVQARHWKNDRQKCLK
jgi:hypothetical protein